MFQHEIVRTMEPQVCVLPRYIVLKLHLFLQVNDIPFDIVGQENFKDGWPGGCNYRGKSTIRNVQAIVTCVDIQNLRDIAESLFHVPPNEITGTDY